MKNILVVEDDKIIASGIIYALEQEGYKVCHCENVNTSLQTIINKNFDLALLDMQLPDGTGFDIREKLPNTPTIFLTVVDDEASIIRAFEGGADDYITKPFRIRELLARVKRTLGTSIDTVSITIGDIIINTSSGKVYRNNNLLLLTALEYRLLLTLAQNKGHILSRVQILESIWDASGNFVEDNTLTVYIKRLREKLGSSLKIETIRGLGYRVD